MKPLIIIPTYVRDKQGLELTKKCFTSVCATVGEDEADVLIVDDSSPIPYADWVIDNASELGFDYCVTPNNGGFSRAVNVGLRTALQAGQDAVLVNADIEFVFDDWLNEFKDGACDPRNPAVQGALLMFPWYPQLVQHAGVYFSVLRREFDHISRFAMHDLPDLKEWRRCPVTAALMYIRHDALEKVGLFDEDFRMGWEDVDYCLRVFAAGGECWYNPGVKALHYEEAFRQVTSAKMKNWINHSHRTLWDKHAGEDFSQWVPTMSGA